MGWLCSFQGRQSVAPLGHIFRAGCLLMVTSPRKSAGEATGFVGVSLLILLVLPGVLCSPTVGEPG